MDFLPFPDGKAASLLTVMPKGWQNLSLKDGSSLILVARNSDSLKVIRTLKTPQKNIRVKNDEVSAELTLKDGAKEYREFSYGWLPFSVLKSMPHPGRCGFRYI